MLSSNTCVRFELFVALLLAGCGSSPAQGDAGSGACVVTFSGDVADLGTPATCAALAQGDAGTWTLQLDTSTTAIARVQVTVDVGSQPAAGVITNETTAAWDVVALSSSTSCTYQAGSDGVPSGSFTLTLTSVDTTSGAVHGAFDAVTYVHAPATTDCGFDDIEHISIQF